MIYDVRQYTLQPNAVKDYFTRYRESGYAVQTKHLGQPIGYFQVEVGILNTVVHVWPYRDIADREARRTALFADAEWMAYLATVRPMMVDQANAVMKGAPFWPFAARAEGPIGLVDFRRYTLHAGKAVELFKLYAAEGLDVQVGHLGRCVGFYQSDIGPQNQILHLWAYRDAADRAQRRAAMIADPKWRAYLARATPLLVEMENMLIVPAPFVPVGAV